MKKQITLSKTVIFGSLLVSTSAFALTTTQQLTNGGRAFVEYTLSNGSKEVCVMPNGSPLADYKKGDLKDELTLCGINFYNNATQKLVGTLEAGAQPLQNVSHNLRPKLNSTNPGVLVASKVDDSVEAKFKQSITCSYAPSALAAYHVSRMLGNAGHTPVSVVRTMDADQHANIIDRALSLLANKSGDVIYKTWSQFKNANSSRSEAKLYADGGDKLYGALSDNVKKEFIYTEVSGVGPYDTRYTRFLQQRPFQRVANSAGVLEIAGGDTKYSTLLPVIQQMRDVSEMVLLDTLLSQDDRIGNIHFHLYKTALEQKQDGTKKLGLVKLTKEEIAQVTALIKAPNKASEADLAAASTKLSTVLQGGKLVRVMVLKDNDCGVDTDKRSNMMRTIDAIEQVRHMSPKTYTLLMKLAKSATDAQTKQFFMSTLLYRTVDFEGHKRSFLANLKRAAEVLNQNCKSGALKLDLTDDFDANGNWIKPAATSCDGI